MQGVCLQGGSVSGDCLQGDLHPGGLLTDLQGDLHPGCLYPGGGLPTQVLARHPHQN